MNVIRSVSNHPHSIYTPQVRDPGLSPMQCHEVQGIISLLHESNLLSEINGLSIRAVDSRDISEGAICQVQTDNV
jgi:hypothetical protein